LKKTFLPEKPVIKPVFNLPVQAFLTKKTAVIKP